MKYKGFIVAASMLFLVGCSDVQHMNRMNVADSKKALSEAIKTDQGMVSKQKLPDPSAVMGQLMPSILSLSKNTSPANYSISVKSMPITEFFVRLAQGLPISILVSDKVKGTVSLSLKNVTMDQIMQAVSKFYGLDIQKTTYGYVVTPKTTVVKMYHINHLDMTREGNNAMAVKALGLGAKIPKRGGGGRIRGGASSVSSSYTNKGFWKELKGALAFLIKGNKGGGININQETGVIMVKAYPATQVKVANFLRETQLIDNRQVVIEAKVIQIQLSNRFSTGIDWSDAHINFNGTTGVVNYISEPAETAAKGFNATIQLLSEQGKVSVLSSPRVSTLNNEQALIKVGSDRYYVTEVSTNTTPVGTTAQESQDVELEPFFSGIILSVLPQISGENYITLHIHPMVSNVKEVTQTIELSKTQVLKLPLAQGNVREVDDVVRARNGQIVVLGGLMESSADTSGTTIPGLGYLGMYPQRSDNGQLTELVILLRAHVVDDHTWIQQLKQAKQRINQYNNLAAYRNAYVTQQQKLAKEKQEAAQQPPVTVKKAK